MKKISSIVILLLAFTACNVTTNTNHKESAIAATTNVAQPSSSGLPVQAQLDEAKRNGKVAFFVLMSNDTTGNNRAVEIADKVNKEVGNSVVIRVNRDDTANAAVVEKWQLSSIPTPAIFIISAKGIPVTSFSLEEANESAIIKDIPSPKMDEAYVALDEKKPVFVLVSRSTSVYREKILANCKSAIEQLKIKAALIEVDQDDNKEKTLLDNFKISPSSNTPTVIVLNADGETTGSFTGTVTTKQLIAAATKVVKTQCCANGESCK
jgi:hypothetical protein